MKPDHNYCPDKPRCKTLCEGLSHALRYYQNIVKLAQGNILVRQRLVNGGSSLQRVEHLHDDLIPWLAEKLDPSSHYDVIQEYLKKDRTLDPSDKVFYGLRVQGVQFMAHVWIESNVDETNEDI